MLFSDKFFIKSFIVHVVLFVLFVTLAYHYTKIEDSKIQITLVPPINTIKSKQPELTQVSTSIKKDVVSNEKEKPKKRPKAAAANPVQNVLESISNKSIDFSVPDSKVVIQKNENDIKPRVINKPKANKQDPEKELNNSSNNKSDVIVKEKDFLKLLDDISSDLKSTETIEDISKSKNILDEEKQALYNNLVGCAVYLSDIQDNDIVVNLKLKMNRDASVSEVKVLSIQTISNSLNREVLERRIMEMFKKPDCSKLDLPSEKYLFWKEFTVNLTLKSFFQ